MEFACSPCAAVGFIWVLRSPPQSIRDTKLSVSMTDLSIQKPVSSARDAGDDQHHVTLQRTSGSVDGWMEYQFKFLPLLQRTGFDLQ